MLYNVVCSPVNVPHTLLDVLCVCFTASYLPSLLLLSVIGPPHPPGTPVVGLHALKADKPVLISLCAGNGHSSLNTEIMINFPFRFSVKFKIHRASTIPTNRPETKKNACHHQTIPCHHQAIPCHHLPGLGRFLRDLCIIFCLRQCQVFLWSFNSAMVV